MPFHRTSSCLLLLALWVVCCNGGKSTVNQKVKIKRDAKAKAKKVFLNKHGMIFDSYGRVLRWGKDPKTYECKENKKIGLYCTVTDSVTRKYRTKEEERRGQLIKLDKQAELDGQFGSGSDDAKKARRRRKENRRRCSLYNEWLENFEKDASTLVWFFVLGGVRVVSCFVCVHLWVLLSYSVRCGLVGKGKKAVPLLLFLLLLLLWLLSKWMHAHFTHTH